MQVRGYLQVFFALLALTAVTVGVSFVDLGALSTAVALAIATVKAALIAVGFMHLFREDRLLWTFAIAGLFTLGLLLGGMLDDLMTRGRQPVPALEL